MAEKLSIGQVARAAGVRPSAIRFYEGAGLVPAAERQSGRRVYDPEVFERLAVIKLAQEAGFTVAEIRELLRVCGSPVPVGQRAWERLARSKIAEISATIAKAEAMKELLEQWLHCRCVTLEDCRLIADRRQSEDKGDAR